MKITIKLRIWDDHNPPFYIGPLGYENTKRQWLPWDVQGEMIGDWGWFHWEDSPPNLFSVTHIPSGLLAKANLPLEITKKVTEELNKKCRKWDGIGESPKSFQKNIKKILKNVQSNQITR